MPILIAVTRSISPLFNDALNIPSIAIAIDLGDVAHACPVASSGLDGLSAGIDRCIFAVDFVVRTSVFLLAR